MKQQIGWFVLKEDTEYRNTFEFAAWYEDVLVKAGRYPVIVHDYQVNEEGRVDGFIGSVYVTMPGTVVRDYFAAHYCGVPISDYDDYKNAGKPSQYTMHVYMYNLAADVLNGGGKYELFPEYEAREIHFVSDIDGRELTTHGIFKIA